MTKRNPLSAALTALAGLFRDRKPEPWAKPCPRDYGAYVVSGERRRTRPLEAVVTGIPVDIGLNSDLSFVILHDKGHALFTSPDSAVAMKNLLEHALKDVDCDAAIGRILERIVTRNT